MHSSCFSSFLIKLIINIVYSINCDIFVTFSPFIHIISSSRPFSNDTFHSTLDVSYIGHRILLASFSFLLPSHFPPRFPSRLTSLHLSSATPCYIHILTHYSLSLSLSPLSSCNRFLLFRLVSLLPLNLFFNCLHPHSGTSSVQLAKKC